MRKIYLMLLAISFAAVVDAQSSANYLPLVTNNNGSLGLDMNSNTLDMSSGTTSLLAASTDDTRSGLTNIGFDFWFMGSRVSNFSCTDNGIIELGGNTVGTSTYLISANTTLKLLAPFADDMRVGTDGVIQYKLFGSAPNRVLVIEYKNIMIRYLSTAAAGTGTWQVRLYETTGVVEYVYGTMGTNSATQNAVNVGFGTNTTANTFVTVDATHVANTSGTFATFTPTASSVVTHLNSAAEGSRRYYRLVSPTPAAPTGLNFTSVSAAAMTLNWTDVATNEVGYAIYRSTDGVNYSFISQTAANATSSLQTGLSASTSYFWKVYAVSEGALSTSLDGSQSTTGCTLIGTYDVGPGAVSGYLTLKQAVDAAALNGTAGPVVFELNAAYTSGTDVTFPIVLGAVPCASAVNTITIRPAAGAGAKTITSANTTATLDINGGNYWIIDGRQGGTGSSKDLTIANTSTATGGTAIRFINEGSNNVVRYSVLKALFPSSTSGVVNFSTTTGANGNDNNTIDNCDIDGGAAATASPTLVAQNGIYSSGTTTLPAQNNSGNTVSNCNIFNWFQASLSSSATAGILIAGGNTDWTISNNSFYQTNTRTFTTSSSSAMYGILVNNTSGNNFQITGNFIGGSAANTGGSAFTIGPNTLAVRFVGIALSVGTTTPSSIQGNTVANFVQTSNTSSTANSTSGPIASGGWAGIYVAAGSANIGTVTANTIGSGSGTGSISYTVGTNAGGTANGIGCSGGGTINISGNTIGSITTSGSTGTISTGIIGIQSNATGTITINNNTIGSTSTANSINASLASTGTTAQIVTGINHTGAAAAISITNNTIANLTDAYVPSAANTNRIMAGISSSNGVNTITGNTIRNMTTPAQATGTTSAASVIGISMTSTTAGTTVGQNTIHTLSNTHATAATNIIGIYYNGATTGTNLIARNFIHSLSLSTSSTSGVITGIHIAGGLHTTQNNMVRLGIDAAGANITGNYAITGINDIASTAGYAIIHNSVYIGGTGVIAGANNTAAFNTATTTNARTFRNNIFTNDRANGAGTGFHLAAIYAGTLPNPVGLTLSHNVYYSGTAANCIRNSTTNYTVATWQSASGQDAGSYQAPALSQISFVNATGNSSAVDLHITGTTVIEGAGSATTTATDDFDGQTRASFTPVDIGADAGNFTVLDLIPPAITYTAIPNTACLTDRSLAATITDASSINTTAGTAPRLYFKKLTDANTYAGNTSADNGWKYVETADVASPYNFSTNYALLQSAVAPGDVIQYFVVAQDLASTPNIAINSGTFAAAPTSVALTSAAFPLTGTINSYTISATLSTSITIGASGATYTTITGAGGLFAALNAASLSGNTTVTIMDASIAETGANALNTINYGCSGGPYTLTIKPNTTSTLTGSVASGALIKLNGASNVIIDGSNSGGSDKSLTITNTSATSPAAIWIGSTGTGTTNNTVKNCIISTGSNAATSYGIAVSNATTIGNGGADNDNVTIQNNTITQVYYGVFANGTATVSAGGLDNLNINNNIIGPASSGATNIGFTGISVGNAVSPSVSLNTIQNLSSAATNASGITVANAATPNISQNTIQSMTSSSTGAAGISLASTVAGATVTQNTVQNVTASAGGYFGISLAGTSGTFSITRNTISNITANINSSSSVIGLQVTSTGTVTIDRNQITGVLNSNTGTFGAFGVNLNGGNNMTVTNNFVSNISQDMTGGGAFSTTFGVFGIRVAAGTGHKIQHNSINMYGALPGTAASSLLTAGLAIVSTTSTGMDIRNNIFVNTMTGGTSSIAHVAVYLPSGGTSAMNLTWNNNAYFTGSTAGVHGIAHGSTTYTSPVTTAGIGLYTAANFNAAATTPITNLRNYTSTLSAAGTNDNASLAFTTAAPFTSNTDLHIPAGTSGQLESGGASVGVTNDYDNDVRPGPAGSVNGGATAPDMGADEFDGTPASPMVYVSSTTTQNTASVSVNTTTNHIIGIQIVTAGTLSPISATSFTLNTNGTTAPLTDITNAKLWYTGTTSTFAATTQFGSTVAAPNGSFNMTGTQTLATGTNYFWLTYDVPCGAVIGNSIDAECNSLTVVSAQIPTVQAPAGSRTIVNNGLSGTKTVGAAGDYTSLTGASGLFAAINTSGLSGNLTANIIDANVTETGAVALNAVNYNCAGPYTITIKPNSTSTLSGSLASSGLIRLNGADYVIIDGSNSGGTDRSLTITNTATTAPSVVQLISLGTGLGATNNTIKNCNISTGVATSSGFSISVGGSTQGTGGADNDNVTIQNNSITNGVVGIYANGTASVSAGGNDNLVITGNTVDYNGTLASIGIDVGNSLNSTVSLNTISEQTSASQSPTGISLETGFVSSSVSRNLITKSVTTNTGGYGGRGITVGTGTATSNLTIDNNVIYGINGSNWTGFSNSSAMGIAIGMVGNSSTITTTAGGIKLYYNSVNMYGNYLTSSTTANKITAALYIGSSASALDIQNNVFVNSMNNTAATATNYAVYSAAANTALTTINYNDYFVSGTQGVLGFLGANQATLAAWQTASGQDANSINADPLFASNTNLQPGIGSPVAAAGTPVSVTIDYTGFIRSVTTPTIGAYEQTGDFSGPVITYTTLGNTLCATDRTLTPVTITDPSNVNTTAGTKPRLYFKKSTDANTYAGNTSGDNGWKYVEATNASSPFSFTTNYSLLQSAVVGGDIIQYFVVAQDLAGTPNVGINSGVFAATPSSVALTAGAFPLGGTINSYTITAGGLSGTVTIGAAGTYPSLTGTGGLFAAINGAGLIGNVTANIIDASVTETGTNALNQASYGCAGPYTLTIKPGAGVTTTLSGSVGTSLIKLNGADYVTIDGSNNGSTSRDMTLTNTGTGAVIWIGTDATAGATNNTLKNFNMIGPGAFGGQGIMAGSGATFGNAAENGRPNSNNTIQNLTARSVQNAIFALGDATTLDQNWLITQNEFGSTVAAEKLSFRGIALQNAQNFTISLNKIIGISSSTSSSSTMSGILVGSTLNGGTITRNEIRDVKQNNTTGWGANGIYLNSSSTAAAVVVTNNFISDVAGQGFDGQDQGDNGYGIMVNNGGGFEVYFNTVLMNTEQTAVDGQPAAINIGTGVAAGGLNLRDNIFAVTQTVGTNYAIIDQGTNAVFAAINYNDYSSTENIGYLATSQATLANWQTATGADANSINVAPVFVSATDLHLAASGNCGLNGRGTPIAGITTDIDGNTRHAVYPDMGADEFTASTTGTMTWTGTVNTDWFDVGNWSCKEVPGVTSDVVIPAAVPNYPNVTGNVTIKTLNVNNSASITFGAGISFIILQ